MECLHKIFVYSAAYFLQQTPTVADSTTESEYIAASEAAKEAVWIKKFITGSGVVPSILDPIELHCHNSGAIAQAKEPRSHQRSKCWSLLHNVRSGINKNFMQTLHSSTQDCKIN